MPSTRLEYWNSVSWDFLDRINIHLSLGSPLQYSCLENPVDRGAWWATVHGVARVKHDLATKPPPSHLLTRLCCSFALSPVLTFLCHIAEPGPQIILLRDPCQLTPCEHLQWRHWWEMKDGSGEMTLSASDFSVSGGSSTGCRNVSNAQVLRTAGVASEA